MYVEYIILYKYIQLYTYVCDHMWVSARKINTEMLLLLSLFQAA